MIKRAKITAAINSNLGMVSFFSGATLDLLVINLPKVKSDSVEATK